MLLKQIISKLSIHKVTINKEALMSIKQTIKTAINYWINAMSTTNMALSLVTQETQSFALSKLKNTQSPSDECCPCC